MVVQNTIPTNIENDGDHDNVEAGEGETNGGPRSEQGSDAENEPEENDLIRLKELIPSVSAKDNVTQLYIILEAIRYIDSLQNRLADKLETGEIQLVPVTKCQ